MKKRLTSLLLVVCMTLGLFSGISISAASPEPTYVGVFNITGVTEPVAAGEVTTAGIGGVEGFDISAIWEKYDY
ncbi:MAG: hypothetical protein IJE84_00595, partial [Clostridia bacterium]|nr:hypothetical protein [Clostridia bacterium]